jgi:hypothetical protein
MTKIHVPAATLLLIFFALTTLPVRSVTFEVMDYWKKPEVMANKKIWVTINLSSQENQIFEFETDNKGQFSVDASWAGLYMIAVIEDHALNISMPTRVPSSDEVLQLIFASSLACHTKNVKDVRKINLQDLFDRWNKTKFSANFFINYIGGYLEASRLIGKEETIKNYDHPNNFAYRGFMDYLDNPKL